MAIARKMKLEKQKPEHGGGTDLARVMGNHQKILGRENDHISNLGRLHWQKIQYFPYCVGKILKKQK
jgi:hypothetical protein